jgi:hypothetical protein
MILEIDCSASFSSDAATEIFIGIAADPTSTTASTAIYYGLIEQHLAAGTPRFGPCTINAANQLTNANNTVGRGLLNAHQNQLSYITGTATGGGAARGAEGRNSNRTFADDVALYLMVAAGTRSTGTTSATDTAVAAIRYLIIKLES